MAAFNRIGTLDSFSLGFSVVHRRPWLIAVPLLLNLFLWLGPSLTAGPVVHGWQVTYLRLVQENPAIAEVQGVSVEEVQERTRQFAEIAGGVNLFRLLTLQTPSLPMVTAAGAVVWELGTAGDLLLAGAALVLGALLIAAVYLTLLAESIRTPGRELLQLPQWLGSNWLRLLGYYALMVAVSAPLLLGLTMVLLTALIFSQTLASLVISLSFGALVLAQFYLFFVPQAIFLARAGPVQAVLQSATVMGRFFWSSLWFIMLNWIIGTGFSLIFGRVYGWHAAGAAAALAGHAYISTGLAAAAMVYFHNRVLLLAEARNARRRMPVSG